MSDLETRLRAIGELLPEPGDRATEDGRRAMHAARASAPWATGRRRSWFSRGPRTYLIAAALALAIGGGALAAGGWSISDLPPFGHDDRSAFVLPATDILPGGYERTRPPRYADLPERPSLLFPTGVGYTEALTEYAAAREAGRVLPDGVRLTDPLPAGKVVMVRSDGRIVLDPAAPFGYSPTTGLVTTLLVPFDGRPRQIARCQLVIGAEDPGSPPCDQPGVPRAYVREGVDGRWVDSPNEEAVFDRLTPSSTELSVIDHPTTPLVRIEGNVPPTETRSGRMVTLRAGRLALQTPDVRLIVVPVKPDRLCFIAEERAGGSSFTCGPRANFLGRGASLSGGRYLSGPYRLNGLVGDGIDSVTTDDGTVARVVHNAFTMLPSGAARVLTFSGPVGSFRIAVPRFSDGGPRRFTPDRSKERELLGVDLADGGHASIRVAPNRGGGRCVWVYVNGNTRSSACSRPGDSPSLPDDMVTGGFIRRINRIPSLFQGHFSSRVGSVEIGYADGTATRLRPTRGYVLYEVPASHMSPGHEAVSITTFDRQGVALVREAVRRPGTVGP